MMMMTMMMRKNMISSSSSLVIVFFIATIASYTHQLVEANTISSYIYLDAKKIREELAPGSFVLNLADELDANEQYRALKSKSKQQQQQFTILEESSKRGGGNDGGGSNGATAYFDLDSTTGEITTKASKRLDRELMCANRQCAESCGDTVPSCRLNLKILLLPSYNIVDLNVLVEDINDNRPQFRSPNLTQLVNENVPVGYKIPIDLAYDPDVGVNSVQRYELVNNVDEVFRLEQNLNDSQLFLVVQSELDREERAEYNLVIRALDGSSGGKSNDPLDTMIDNEQDNEANKSLLRLNIQLVDINDNNPIFESELYKFVVSEDAPLDSEIGHVLASDRDTGVNSQIRYSFVDTNVTPGGLNKLNMLTGSSGSSSSSASPNYAHHFALNESTGAIRLKSPLDFEKDSQFALTVEARDSGVGSLPAYAHVQIDVLDVNDNRPEITVSFLSTLTKAPSTRLGLKYDVFLPENSKSGKFIAHVSIVDRDSSENGRFDWEVRVNGMRMDVQQQADGSDSILRLVKLNANSFTLNVGESKHLDREQLAHIDVSISAWDSGHLHEPTLYNFTIRLVDVNDNAPRFDASSYDFDVSENNEPGQVIGRVHAHDADVDAANSNLTYSIREKSASEYFRIDPASGELSSTTSVRFDRESIDKFTFHVVATDMGGGGVQGGHHSPHQAALHSSALVTVNIRDVNDNHPSLSFNSSHYHRFHQINSRISSAYFRLSDSLPIGARLIDFRASDRDLESRFEFEFEKQTTQNSDAAATASANNVAMFRLTPGGQLYLARRLDKKKQSIHELNIVCKDSPGPDALNATIKLTIEVVDEIEPCIRGPEKYGSRYGSWSSSSEELEKDSPAPIGSIYINRDRLLSSSTLFNVDYSVERHFNKRSSQQQQQQQQLVNRLSVQQHTHVDLIEASLVPVEPASSSRNFSKNLEAFKLELKLRDEFLNDHLSVNNNNASNNSKLMLGKYTIRVSVVDRLTPTCTPRSDVFYLYVGNNFIDQNELVTLLKSIRYRNRDNNNNNNNESSTTFENVNSIKKLKQRLESNDNDDYDLGDDRIDGRLGSDFLFGGATKSTGGGVRRFFPFKYFNGDFVLLFILVLIVAITALLLAFLTVMCIYGRYKKQYRSKSKKSSDDMMKGRKKKSAGSFVIASSGAPVDDEDFVVGAANEESLNFTSKRLKSCVGGSNKKSSKFLNTSTSSSETNSDELDKPQYTRVHNQHGSSSNTSNGTLAYKDEEDSSSSSLRMPLAGGGGGGGVGVITSCNGTIRQYQPMSKPSITTNTMNPKYHAVHTNSQRFFQPKVVNPNSTATTTTTTTTSGYETNRSHSGGGESTTIETTTTIDECCSKLSSSSHHSTSSPTSSTTSSNHNPLHHHHHHHHPNDIKSSSHCKLLVSSSTVSSKTNSIDNHTNLNHLNHHHHQHPHHHHNHNSSSAYSSISTSDTQHISSDSDHSGKVNILEPFEDAIKKTLDSGLLSFKKHNNNNNAAATSSSSSTSSNSNYIQAQTLSHQQQHQLLLAAKNVSVKSQHQSVTAPLVVNRRGEPTTLNTNSLVRNNPTTTANTTAANTNNSNQTNGGYLQTATRTTFNC